MKRTEPGGRRRAGRLLRGLLLAFILAFPFLAQGLPLLGVLDAEYATAAALLLGGWGVVEGWRRVARARHEGRGRLKAGPLALRGLLLAGYLLVAMGIITSLVWECRLGPGPLIFVIMVLPAPLLGLGLGAFSRAWGRTPGRAAGWLALLILLLVVAPPLLRGVFLQQAPHSLLTGVWGLVSVFGYRAEAALTRVPTLVHRAGALVVAALLLSLTEALLRRRAGLPSGRREGASVVVSAALLALLLAGGDRSGFGTGRGGLRRHLHAEAEEAGLVLRYDPAYLAPEAARRLLDDALWHRRDLSARLGLGEPGPVTLWAFSPRSLRRGSVGLSYWNMAAPWRGEAVIHVSPEGRSPTLRHELVHLLAAPWKPSFFRVPIDPTRTEGLATALEKRLDLGGPYQRPFAAALAAGKLPYAGTFLGAKRFWTGGQSVHNVYQLSGSFVGVLLERFGTEPVRGWYAGASLQEAFGQDVEALDALWRSRLADLETGESEQESARWRLEEGARNAVHRTRCGRLPACDERSLRLEAYYEALGAKRWEEVLLFLDDESLFPAARPGARRQRAWILELAHRELGTPGKAVGPVEDLLAELPPGDEGRPRVFESLLRLELAADRKEEARRRLAIQETSDPGLLKDLHWLGVALETPDSEEALAVFIETEPLKRAEGATDLLDRHPGWPGLARWTWHRQLWLGDRREAALDLGEELRARGEEIPSGPLALLYEEQARKEEDEGRLAAAAESWRAAEELHEDPLGRARARDERHRLAWRLERSAGARGEDPPTRGYP